ncbi:tripartite tricarboxylate transporter substrate binding protein [Pusillimonas sp. SM2304]|uniref:Bug family tripartite tricarboxylate transporter substrate binding protein n=1 Tax=Pusillimonas sp. SM2304 TaxID=3073241 RepID=UPI002874C101|nr:tripartite tricarboxylate transporter substrate binding protein [Pusillimonas sp. SM2304]MDS1141627.1 tripartite tricarboxylate transporter substrate binding protein [Pusillimonas sp. SM2304]
MQKIHIKSLLEKIARRSVAGAGVLALSAAPALAQAWPEKPVSLVVPFAAGGTTDVLARALGDELSKSLGQTVIVENKPGAGATLGADIVARAKPDGYTLLMGAVHHTIATSVYKTLSYDFQKSFDPITIVALVPNVLVINAANTPAKTAGELVELAKKATTSLAYGSNGYGTLQHLIGTQFAMQNNIELLHVPYKGSGPLTTDLIGGQVAMSFDTVTPVLPHIQAGKLRALAVTTAKRSSALPDTPTLNESGMHDFDLGTWFGMLAPAGTPADVLDKLNTEMVKIIKSDSFRDKMSKIGAETIGNSRDEMAAQIDNDTKRFAEVIKKANITVN